MCTKQQATPMCAPQRPLPPGLQPHHDQATLNVLCTTNYDMRLGANWRPHLVSCGEMPS